jgi:HEAT repeat protein
MTKRSGPPCGSEPRAPHRTRGRRVDLDAIIARRHPHDFEALRRLLTTDPAVNRLHRARAVYALGRWGDPSVVEDIPALLIDPSDRVRSLAASQLE